jgi:hypothetical protein
MYVTSGDMFHRIKSITPIAPSFETIYIFFSRSEYCPLHEVPIWLGIRVIFVYRRLLLHFFTRVSNFLFLIHFSGLITIGRWKGINDICDTCLKELSTKLPAAHPSMYYHSTGLCSNRIYTKWHKHNSVYRSKISIQLQIYNFTA